MCASCLVFVSPLAFFYFLVSTYLFTSLILFSYLKVRELIHVLQIVQFVINLDVHWRIPTFNSVLLMFGYCDISRYD